MGEDPRKERAMRETAARIDRMILSRRELLKRRAAWGSSPSARCRRFLPRAVEAGTAADDGRGGTGDDASARHDRRSDDGGGRDDRRGHGPRRQRDDRLPLVGGLRPSGSDEGLEAGERRQDPADVHRQPQRHRGQAQGLGQRRGLRPDHVLPGLQAAVRRAPDPVAHRPDQDPEPRRSVPVLRLGRAQLLGRSGRHPNRGSLDVRLAGDPVRRGGHPRSADLLGHASRPEVQGQGGRRRRHRGQLRPRVSHPRLRRRCADAGSVRGGQGLPAPGDRPDQGGRPLVR